MKTAILYKDKKVKIIDQEIPKAKDNFVVIKVHSSPMCTEFYNYRDGLEDLCLGHEAAGEIVAVGDNAKANIGDRVVVMPQYPCGNCELCSNGDYIHCENVVDPYKICDCNTGIATYSQYVIKQDWLLLPIPGDISYDQASMACCGLGASFGAIKIVDVNKNDTVLITGLGPVGLGAIINCTNLGARVIGVTRNKYRTKLAYELGADKILDPTDKNCIQIIKEMTIGLGADKTIECSGGKIYQRICLDGTKRKGQIAFVGESEEFPLKISDDLIRNGLTLHGAWHWNLKYTQQILDIIVNSTDKINELITHTFPIDKVEDAFKLQMTGECGKVILHPWE